MEHTHALPEISKRQALAVTLVLAFLFAIDVPKYFHPCAWSSNGMYRVCEHIMECPADARIVPRPIPTLAEYLHAKCGNKTSHCPYGEVTYLLDTTDCYSTRIKNPFCGFLLGDVAYKTCREVPCAQ
jgi:hypothetical protein